MCYDLSEMSAYTVQGNPGYDKLTITNRELFERLTWFTHVRWAFGLFCLLVLLASWYGFGVRFHHINQPPSLAPAVHVILVLFLYNAVFTFLNPVLRARQHITRRLIVPIALAQIGCDLAAISVLIHFTGGVENPFIILILVPLAIVSELLPQSLAYATAAAAAVLLNALAWGEQQRWLAHVHIALSSGTPLQSAGLFADWRHVLTLTAALTVTIFAMVFVTTTIAARLRWHEDRLQKTYDALHSADESKSFFMRRAEHEMRAPLAAIHSLLSTLSENLSLEQMETISRVQRRTTALMALVKDLRRYSQFRTPDRIFEVQQFKLDAIINNTVNLFRPQAQQQGLTLTASVQPVQMEGNEEMLRELVTNLVSNALQYTPAGGKIEVTLRQDGETADLAVADTGIGISPEKRERIFEEFYRTPQAKTVFQDGTGLGLAIVSRIVQIHHGDIDVRENPAGGTVFSVRLPLKHQAEKVKL